MGGLFGSKPKAPKIPEPPAPTPVVDEVKVADAKSKAVLRARQRGGRASTILSDADKLGG